MTRRLATLGALCLLLAACGRSPSPEAPAMQPDPRRDHHSYANTTDFTTTNLTLALTPDFDARVFSGTVTLDLERRRSEASELVLDTRDLDIAAVEAAGPQDEFMATDFAIGERDPILGSPLAITMPAQASRVRIHYATRPDSTGLQWLEPSQTAGGRQPFVYTQAQAIHARSFVPLQDTPQVRVTLDVTLHTPPGFTAVMAAETVAAPAGGPFVFRMPQPIPSYLIAFAIGDLRFQALSERTGVWAEPAMLARAAAEFADTERMIQQAESLYGPYRWGRFDILVLPPAFPWGGMENPRLTFATPTIIAGDKSLVSLIAHELAHSWSGNLVTNASWQDVWLNEGFTVYFERRIMEAVYGERRARMEWGIGLRDLREDLDLHAQGQQQLGALTPDLRGMDPDEGFSDVPYEKGALLLYQLERRFGREAFDAFLRQWFDGHAFTSQSTPDFLAVLERELLQKHPGKADLAFVQRWLAGTDLPSDALLIESDAFDRVAATRDAWLSDDDLEALASASGSWTVQEWLHFLDGLPRDLATGRMRALDARFGLTASGNAEIAHGWYRLAISAGYREANAAIERYLMRIGRRKLIVPLYRDLAQTPEGMKTAQRIYAAARPLYHSIARSTIEKTLEQAARP